MNKDFFKRYSTWANAVAMVVGAMLVSVPNLDLEPSTVAIIMMIGNGVVAVAQFIKQGAKDVR